MSTYDIAVIGAGPAGYVAAIRAAQLGFATVCIDNFKNEAGDYVLGGTCLNVGCIPSKSLLETSHRYHYLKQHAVEEGISFTDLSFDLGTMMKRKDKIISSLTGGIKSLLKANGVEIVHGHAKVVASGKVEVKQGNKAAIVVDAKHIILATGSAPVEIPSAHFDGKFIVDSTGALSFESVPEKLTIVGAGVIGLELGSVWSRLGSEVTIIEALPDFLPSVDVEISKKLSPIFSKQGLNIQLGAKLLSAKVVKGKVNIEIEKNGKVEKSTVDKLVVSVGRRPLSQDLCTPDVGVKVDGRGFVEVDLHCQTSVKNIYAIGDLVRGPMLAHKGSEEGVMVVERIAGEHTEVNYDTIPNVVYTDPEIAWVGKTEQELRASGVEYKSGVFPMAASGRAMANNDTTGFVKTLIEANTNRILGVHIACAHAGELLAQSVTAMEFGSVAEDISMITFAHPTLSEALKESALAALGHAVHIAQKRK